MTCGMSAVYTHAGELPEVGDEVCACVCACVVCVRCVCVYVCVLGGEGSWVIASTVLAVVQTAV